MSEQDKEYEAKCEAYNEAMRGLNYVLAYPEKQASASDYEAKLEAAQNAVDVAHGEMMMAYTFSTKGLEAARAKPASATYTRKNKGHSK